MELSNKVTLWTSSYFDDSKKRDNTGSAYPVEPSCFFESKDYSVNRSFLIREAIQSALQSSEHWSSPLIM